MTRASLRNLARATTIDFLPGQILGGEFPANCYSMHGINHRSLLPITDRWWKGTDRIVPQLISRALIPVSLDENSTENTYRHGSPVSQSWYEWPTHEHTTSSGLQKPLAPCERSPLVW